MKRMYSALICVLSLVAMSCAPCQADEDLLDSFEKHLASLDVESVQLDSAKKAIAEFKSDSVADAITEALISLYPQYEDAIMATDEEDVEAAIDALAQFTASKDQYLAADASFYLARTLMNDERYEQALPLITRIGREFGRHSVHLPTLQYYRGVAQEGLLKNEEAINSFMEFLQFNPDAPERLRVNAWRKVQELQSAGQKKFDEIEQKMDYSRRRLKLENSGEQTQGEQNKIVILLNQMIKEQQKKECSQCNSKSQNTKKQQQQKQQQAKKKNKSSKQSQQGGTSNNPNGVAQKKTYDDSPASPWSRLRDRSRDPANNALKEKLPAKYREIVDRYYERANGNGEKK